MGNPKSVQYDLKHFLILVILCNTPNKYNFCIAKYAILIRSREDWLFALN